MTLDLGLKIASIVLSLLLMLVILVQQRGTGLGGAFGGEGTVYRTRRGAERFLFRLTILLAIIYVGAALASVIL